MKKGVIGLVVVAATWSSSAASEVVEVSGAVAAYFPDGQYEVVLNAGQRSSVAHADEADMLFYTVNSFKGHGEAPSEKWVNSFASGSEVILTNSSHTILSSSYQNGEVLGDYVVQGLLDGVRYNKACRFLMNSDDYGTWCVAMLGANSNEERAVSDFRAYRDSFRLLD